MTDILGATIFNDNWLFGPTTSVAGGLWTPTASNAGVYTDVDSGETFTFTTYQRTVIQDTATIDSNVTYQWFTIDNADVTLDYTSGLQFANQVTGNGGSLTISKVDDIVIGGNLLLPSMDSYSGHLIIGGHFW